MLTILVADSQRLFAQALARALQREPDFEVCELHPQSGVHAAQAAVIVQPSVALLDLWLKGIAGPEAVRSIVAKSPDTKVMVLGWFHRAEHVSQAFDAGARAFVSKSLSTVGLVDSIRRVAAGERVTAEGYHSAACNPPPSPAADAPRGRGTFGEALTPRELEVLELLGAGWVIEEIAGWLGIARETTRRHVTGILTKTGTRSQLQAVAVARDRGALA